MGLLARAAQRTCHMTFCSTRRISSFKFKDLEITLTDKPSVKPPNEDLKFGKTHSDHMLEIDWKEGSGWGRPVIRPLEALRIHPAAKVLHYATELFEGMKAYRCTDNKIRFFRPMENLNRMEKTTIRTGLPQFDKDELLKCLKKLVSIDQEWVPYGDKCSLYVRPTFIGTEPALGVTYSTEAKLFAIVGPTGPYFPTGMKAVRLLADPQWVRAWPGGCGNFKMGSNYAPTVSVQREAVKQGCSQMLWLYGEEHYMTEAGTMNLFIYWINEDGDHELVTPSLESGLILPGVTRKSLIEMAREWNEFKVTERDITMGEFVKGLNEGRVKEVFGAGTACLVCPINKILYKGEDLVISESDEPQPLTKRFYEQLGDIHYYRTPHSWMDAVEEEGVEAERTLKAH